MRFFFAMFYNCTKFQNNPRGSVEKHPKICWIDMEWRISDLSCTLHNLIFCLNNMNLLFYWKNLYKLCFQETCIIKLSYEYIVHSEIMHNKTYYRLQKWIT